MSKRSSAAVAERRVAAPMEHREGNLQPSSWNAETRTIDVVWTTGSRGAKLTWEDGIVDEELATAAVNVRLGRLNGGAPVLNSHQRGDLGGQIGVVVPGSARMDRGQGIATLRLSDRADLAPIISDIGAGIIRNVSVGYTVHAYDIEKRPNQRPLYRAVDWEPFEISFVPVPFDAAAQVRSRDSALEPHSCTLRTLKTMEPTMRRNRYQAAQADQFDDPASPPSPPAPTGTSTQPATIAQLREYGDMVAQSNGIDPERCAAVILDMAERGLTFAQASSEMMQALAERQRSCTGAVAGGGNAVATAQALGGGRTFDNPDFHSRAIEDAIYCRLSGRQPSDQAREFMGMTMVEMAGDMLARRGFRDVNRMAPNEILEASAFNRVGARALFVADRMGGVGSITTSDFPDLLSAAGQRFLLDIFAAAASAIKVISRERTARDFRQISGLQLSGFGTLPKVVEAGELKHGKFEARKETYRLETFGKQFSLSRQAMINDDLGAFGDPIRIMGRAAAETEASVFADLINSNPVLASDNKAIFHADHGNLAVTGGAPDVTRLAAGRLAMRSQKDLDGVTPLATAPKYVLASPTNETLIEQLLVATTVPTTASEANPFAGKLTPLIDPRLNPNPWYLAADPALAPVLEHAYLNGHVGPHFDTKEGWDTLGTSFRIYMDFGAGIVDYRGIYKNPGA